MERKIEIVNNVDELTIIIPKTGNWLIILLTGSWCLMGLYLIFKIVQEGMLFRDSLFIAIMAGILLIWLFVLKTFLWHVRGKEKITIDKEYLKINRIGTFLTLTRKYELNLIDEFTFTESNNVTWWSNLYGLAGGHISFDYWESAEYFGQSVDKSEARLIIEQLNEKLRNYAQQRL